MLPAWLKPTLAALTAKAAITTTKLAAITATDGRKMKQFDDTNPVYVLADKWIEIILANKPELLVTHFQPATATEYGKPPEFNLEGAVNSARALAEFRQQLANALSAQHLAAPAE